MKTEEIGVITLIDENGLRGLIYKDPATHKNVFYRCDEMSFAELKGLFASDPKI